MFRALARRIFPDPIFEPERVPQRGERYVLDSSDRDPWGIKQDVRVTVVDCRDRWVRYRMDGHPADDARTVENFNAIYVPEIVN